LGQQAGKANEIFRASQYIFGNYFPIGRDKTLRSISKKLRLRYNHAVNPYFENENNTKI
jgi:hypothetical protein